MQLKVTFLNISAISLILFFLTTSTFCARILGVVPTPSYSHQVMFYPLWRELSLRGHQVTVITTHPLNNSSLTNLTEIHLIFKSEGWDKIVSSANKVAELGRFAVFDVMAQIGYKIVDETMQYPEVHKLIKNEDEHFDILLVEPPWPGVVAFGERFKCPMIQIFSADTSSLSYYLIGNPSHPVLNPDRVLPFAGKLSFFERLTSTLTVLCSVLYHKYRIFPLQDSLVQKYFGPDVPPVEELLRNSDLMFVNTDYILHPIRPLLPNVIQIGGGSHVTEPKPLPKDLQKILDASENGVIYFSLGSNVQSSLLSERIKKIVLDTFAQLPYTVIWKFEENLQGKPENVFISKWLPQQDILRHPNVKLFITQGGLHSMDEAVHNKIPIIGIPFISDQKYNILRAIAMGIGLEVNINTIDRALLNDTILDVMTNPKYGKRVSELAELVRDQPATGLERAVWWTEYVIRHKGAKHLRSPALQLPTYQYFLLDVISFILLVVLVVVYVFVKLAKLVLKFVRYLLPKSKVKTQ